MPELGITTVEGKTGYGEDTETEDKMLRVMERLIRTTHRYREATWELMPFAELPEALVPIWII